MNVAKTVKVFFWVVLTCAALALVAGCGGSSSESSSEDSSASSQHPVLTQVDGATVSGFSQATSVSFGPYTQTTATRADFYMFVSNYGNSSISRVPFDATTVAAGTPEHGWYYPPLQPQGIYTKYGYLFITSGNRIYRVSATNASDAGLILELDASDEKPNTPVFAGFTTDDELELGNVFVADSANATIYKIDYTGNILGSWTHSSMENVRGLYWEDNVLYFGAGEYLCSMNMNSSAPTGTIEKVHIGAGVAVWGVAGSIYLEGLYVADGSTGNIYFVHTDNTVVEAEGDGDLSAAGDIWYQALSDSGLLFVPDRGGTVRCYVTEYSY